MAEADAPSQTGTGEIVDIYCKKFPVVFWRIFVLLIPLILDMHLTVGLFHCAAPFSLYLVFIFRNDGRHVKRVGHGGDWRFSTIESKVGPL